ncbi:MAG: LacI family transcriptional regulator [Gaiellaceae bacterium]|jgi:DNA-binding LacI/PurR family transcriptional regulator|nr:LacI family transcriptional regulator [Gaiellaceae bacterium]
MSAPRRTAAEVYERLRREEDARSEYAGGEEQLGVEIGFVFTSLAVADDNQAFYGPLVSAARRRAATFGCDVVYIAPTADSWLEASSVERCVEHGAAGLVVFGGADGNPDVLSERWDGLPTVFVEYDTLGSRSAHVGIDNETAFAEIVGHLADANHSRIATITGPLDTRVAAERLIGYRAMMERLGYPPRPEYIQVGDYSVDSGRDGMRRLLALETPPDAVAVACDVQAIGAIMAIEEAGLRCPEDVAITGFDDADFAVDLDPGLTTVRQPSRDIGIAAVNSLVAMIRDSSIAPPVVLLPGELIVRDSCGALLSKLA